MKNLKKLVIASFMLVIAFVAVVSSTYAWFTQSSEAKVNNIEIQVVDASNALLISHDKTNWGKEVKLDYVGKITPTTLVGDNNAMKEIAFTEEDLKPYYKDAFALDESAENANATKEGYIVFDLYFQLDSKDHATLANSQISVDLTNLRAYDKIENGFSENDNPLSVSSFRMGIATVVGATETFVKVIEGGTATNGRYGQGTQFLATNAWMARYAQAIKSATDTTSDPMVSLGEGEGADFELIAENAVEGTAVFIDNGENKYEYNIDTFYQADYSTAIGETDATGYAHLKVYVWMEGWDGDCINAASGCKYNFGLNFEVTEKPAANPGQ